MRKVVIRKPVDGYAIGETVEVFGWRGRELIAAGLAEWADEPPAAAPTPSLPQLRQARSPKRKRT
ncbi:MAG: hypothetical protein J0H54_01605 [Rhizobiales bacterium]|nr:hypothetical protein [Hyphomicrobiales bacterium]